MNSRIKVVLTIIVTLIICFMTFVTIDTIRLRNSEVGTKPFITTKVQIENKKINYTGLGYNVRYYLNSNIEDESEIKKFAYGAEFRILDKYLIWAWVE